MSKEAIKLAIEALQYPLNTSHEGFNVDMAELLAHRAIKALEEALTQEQGEPVAWMHKSSGRTIGHKPYGSIDKWYALYTKPQPKQEQGEPLAFKIYKPTPPRHAIPNVRDAELPWVYDQDPSSGNVASMWVTPVQTLRSKTWKTKEQ